MVRAEELLKGQKLRVDLDRVRDRLPSNLSIQLKSDPYGYLVGFKMVDGNSFGLVLRFEAGHTSWFFEDELYLEEE